MTAVVTKGAQTASGESLSPAVPKGTSAKRLLDQLQKELSEQGTLYVGNAGHLYLEPPRSIYAEGKVVDRDPGLFLDFNGLGITRPYFPEKNTKDREYCKRLDQIIKDRHPDVVQYDIKRLEAQCPAPPCQRWNTMNPEALKNFVEANLGDNHEENVNYVKACAKFETFRTDSESGKKDVRENVLAMLDGLLVSEAALTSAFDAEITLS